MCIRDRNESVDELMEYIVSKEDINIRSPDGHAALHYAGKAGQLRIVEILIANGADLNAQTLKGNTPLHGAAYKGQVKVVLTLLNAGAEKSIKNADGDTALDRAMQHHERETIEALR